MELNQSQSNDLRIVFSAFYEEPKTMKEVDVEYGIMRESICRYCSTLRKLGRLFSVGKRRCKVTKRVVNIWSTNPNEVPLDTNQLGLFTKGD